MDGESAGLGMSNRRSATALASSCASKMWIRPVAKGIPNQFQRTAPVRAGSSLRGCRANFSLFLFHFSPSVLAVGSVPTVWYLCVSTATKRLCAEVSCPSDFEGGLFEGFSKRIWVIDEDLDPTPRRDKGIDDGDEPNYEVRIAKK